jgi:multidrug efflux pump subunit AcrB
MFARYIYTHSRYFALIVVCALAVGYNSLNTIPRQEDPTLTNFVATVTTFFPGATPDRVEALVTRPLEDELRSLAEVKKIESTSSSGVSVMTIRLHWTLSDAGLEQAWSEVRDALGEAALTFPPGVAAPTFDNDRATSYTTIVALSGRDGTETPLSILNRLAQEFSDRVRNLPDTRLVELFGEPQEEIRVEIDEAALLSRGLSLAQVAAALQAADVKVASGRAVGAGTDMLVELSGDLDSLERIRQVIVNTSPGGSATRISDLGRVYKAEQSPPRALAYAEGRPAILVGTLMAPGGRVDRWSASFSALVEEFRAASPAGIDIAITYDQASYTRARLAEVGINLLIGVGLVILVLLFTLGWRAALVVAVMLPLSGLISITLMERFGIALQQMSVSGLIVALGLLVDGSIVMTDEIRKRLLRGYRPLDAIGESVARLRVPLIASALTTVLAFTPMAIAPGPAGDFIGSIALAVIIMLGVSTLLALVMTPVLAAWVLPRTSEQAGHWYLGGVKSGRLGAWLSASLDWTLAHPVAGICLALALPLAGFLSFPTLTAQFFPGTDRDQFYLQLKLSDGRSIEDTRALALRIDQKLRAEPLIRRVDWSIGESAPPFYYNMARTREAIPSWAEALVLTHDEDRTDDLIRRLQRELDREFPAARAVVRGIDQGPPVAAPLEVEIYGPNLAVMQELGEQFRARIEAVPSVTHTTAGLAGGAPKLVFQLQEEKLRLANLQLIDAAGALNDSLLGRVGGEVLEGTERLPVRVRLREQDWGTSDRISDIRLPLRPGTAAGSALTGIPLNAVGRPALLPAQSPISRINGERVNTVQGYLVRGVLPQEALDMLAHDLEQNPIALPPGYRYRFGGDSQERAELVNDLMAPMPLIMAALMATIVLTFNSWRLSGAAALVCICSMGLSLLALAVFRYPFGIQAMMGVIGSIGVSINAAIIIMTALQADGRANGGDVVAIRDVVMDSSRHIISTTVTTFGGFLPLLLEGSKFWPPFAMAIAGGVLLSTVISFYLVPPLFLLLRAGPFRGLSKKGESPLVSGVDYAGKAHPEPA